MDRREEDDEGSGGDDAVLGDPPRVPDSVWERVLAATFGTDDLEAWESDLGGSHPDTREVTVAMDADALDFPSPGDAGDIGDALGTGEHDD